MSTTKRNVRAPVVIVPDRAGHDRMVMQAMNKYHQYLKEARTDWKQVVDRFGRTVAVVPSLHLSFKDGSDIVLELQEAGAKAAAGNHNHTSNQ